MTPSCPPRALIPAPTFPAPKWQFLCYAAEQHHLALHDSGSPQIEVFEPRQSNDLKEFGSRKAVYAAADGIWAMFFAIVDRERFHLSLNNACIRNADRLGHLSPPRYVFSVSRAALAQRHRLPAAARNLHPAAPLPFGEVELRIPQLASLEPVVPLAIKAKEGAVSRSFFSFKFASSD